MKTELEGLRLAELRMLTQSYGMQSRASGVEHHRLETQHASILKPLTPISTSSTPVSPISEVSGVIISTEHRGRDGGKQDVSVLLFPPPPSVARTFQSDTPHRGFH